MPKRIDPADIIGRTFGAWTVVEYAGRDSRSHDLYLCRCECGTERIVGGPRLRNGRSKSCGCRSNFYSEMVGQTFGSWTVLEYAGRGKGGHFSYLCRCVCGRQKIVIGPALRNGTSKSCGCSRRLASTVKKPAKEKKRAKLVDLTGQQIGAWTVLAYAGTDKNNVKRYRCRCICGTERDVGEYRLREGHSRSCGCLRREAKPEDNALIGQQFGSWTVLEYSGKNKNSAKCFKCRCICGTERDVVKKSLLSGRSKSCGCQRKGRGSRDEKKIDG